MLDILKKIRMYGFRKSVKYASDELIRIIYYGLVLKSYSQHQEDLTIDGLLGFSKKGFYVDIGAYEPNRLSNTKRFYNKGWSGINIEPNPSKVSQFFKYRKRDINLNIGISTESGILNYYDFFPSTLGTFSEKDRDIYIKKGFELVQTTQIPVKRLSQVLLEQSVEKIDFMSIDVEGYDLEVLKSNDWSKYRPQIICVEIVTAEETGKQSNRIINYMIDQGYEIAYHNGLNAFFRDLF